jgi:hypothetical protein
MDHAELKHKTVTELREMAHKYEDIQGVIGMKKDALIDILCEKMGIQKTHALPTGLGRHALKERIHALKKRRDEALAASDPKALKRTRTLLRRSKHRLRDVIEKARRIEAIAAAKKKKEEAAQPAES